MTDLEKWLDSVKQRLGKATPGPWYHPVDDVVVAGAVTQMEIIAQCDGGGTDGDPVFIAHAPTDLKKAVMIIEYLSRGCGSKVGTMEDYKQWESGMDKIAAMSDEEIWQN